MWSARDRHLRATDREPRLQGGRRRARGGLGGLVDGIVLHQVLQWHNFVAIPVPPDTLDALQTNVFWDGVFHVATTAMLLVGLVLLQRSWRRGDRVAGDGTAIVGWVLIGWGAFQIVDQLVFHELLDLHDIRMGVDNPGVYNWSWGASGLVLIALGLWLLRRWRDRTPGQPPTTAPSQRGSEPPS